MTTPTVMQSSPVLAALSGVRSSLELVVAEMDAVRLIDRTAASDEQRLTWVEQIAQVERRAAALKVLLVAEAEEANSAMRARQMRLADWLARSGQQTPGQVRSVMWAGRLLERRPQVRDAAAAWRIGLDQAKAIGEGPRRTAGELRSRAAATGRGSDPARR